jgi:hypothetical protein
MSSAAAAALSVEFVGVDRGAQAQPYKCPRVSLIDAARAP